MENHDHGKKQVMKLNSGMKNPIVLHLAASETHPMYAHKGSSVPVSLFCVDASTFSPSDELSPV